MRSLILTLCLLAAGFTPAVTFANQTEMPEPAPKKQFIYVLKLQPAYKSEAAWTPAINETVGKHFNYLKDLTAKGTVIMAGRSDYDVSNENVFGIVVFEAANSEEAGTIMQNDPAVKGKIMTAELHPFSVALQRK